MSKLGLGISGLSVATIAAGGLLIYSGIVDAPILDALKDLLSGRPPQGRTAKKANVTTRSNLAGAIAAGGLSGALQKPVDGPVGDGFGAARPGGRTHKGIDISAATGTPIHAAETGTVANTGYEPGGAGNFVNIDHANGLRTKYFHLSRFAVGRGANVSRGDVIGYVGSTGRSSGPHLHFEVWSGGAARDPMGYL